MRRIICFAAIAASLAAHVWSAEAPARLGAPSNRVALPPISPLAGGLFEPAEGETIVWIGGENSVIEQDQGWIEANLTAAWQALGKSVRVRHMGWEGDTVYRQNRMENWGSWQENLAAVNATTVFAWFGGMEALDSTRSSSEFIAAYEKLLDEIGRQTKRVVIVTPPPFERPANEHVPDHSAQNERLAEFVQALRELAQRRNALFVDVFTPLRERATVGGGLTRNGVHLTSEGLQAIAPQFLRALGLGAPRVDETVRGAIREKNRLWFDIWRPMNWAFAYGDRTTQPFAKAVPGSPPFVEELMKTRPRVEHAEATIRALASGASLPEPLPAEPSRSDPPALSPEEQMKNFKLRAGFDINLFADEKLGVVRPVQMRWDERGRLWVVCAPSYPQLQPGERAEDFILVLEDSNEDGIADRSFRWAEGLKMPMGLEFGPDGVFICESTQLVLLRDTDGDNRADQREVIMSGFGTGDSHQNINSVRWGGDGHLWFTQGYHIWSFVETPNGIVELNRSGIWRLNPRTLKLESFLNESAAGLNCWGVTFDDWGQVFHGSGADFSIWHTTPALIPALQPLNLGQGFARSKGKSMEPEFLGSSHLPEDLRGVLLKSIYFTSQVGLYRLRDEGAGYVSEDLGDLIAGSPEFRPLETRVGPDGAIYICDWLNPVIGHYQASYRDPRRDRSHGRIWRMTATGRPLLNRPKLETMTEGELAEQLRSPERWNRDQAKYLLYRRPTAAASVFLWNVLRTETNLNVLYEVSGIMAAHEGSNRELVGKFQRSPDFRWRAWGARLAGLWSQKLPEPLNHVRRAVLDEHPRVRMEGVVAASTVREPQALALATLVLDRPMDPAIEHALTLCIHQLAPVWQPALASGQLDFGDRFDALARVLSTVGETNIAARLRPMLAGDRVKGESREKLLAVLAENGSAADSLFALSEAPDSRRVLSALVKAAERGQREGMSEVSAKLMSSSSAASRAAGGRIVAAAGASNPEVLSALQKMLRDPEASVEERQAGIAALLRVQKASAWDAIYPHRRSKDIEVRGAALRALSRIDARALSTEAAAILAEASSAREAGAVIEAFVNDKDGPAMLAMAVASAGIGDRAATASLEWMAQNGRDNGELLGVLRKAAGIATERLVYSEDLVRKLAAQAIAKGNAEAGARMVRRQELSCLGCHRIGNDGPPNNALGPDLSAIGRAMTPETVVESVLWPKRQVKEGFLMTQITMKDGGLAQGFKESESRTELILRGVDGTMQTLLKADIKERSDVGTLMPDGLADGLNEQERLDLLAFLLGLGK